VVVGDLNTGIENCRSQKIAWSGALKGERHLSPFQGSLNFGACPGVSLASLAPPPGYFLSRFQRSRALPFVYWRWLFSIALSALQIPEGLRPWLKASRHPAASREKDFVLFFDGHRAEHLQQKLKTKLLLF
jgi:hypothetical protein